MSKTPINRRKASRVVCAAASFAALGLVRFAHADPSPFYLGTDISLLPTIEQASVGNYGPGVGGATGNPFKDGGVQQASGTYSGGVSRAAEQILVNHGDNIFRIRIFVNPQTTYTGGVNGNNGAIQTTAYDIALANRLKATGAKVILDFHYSDTWADPGHQAIPSAWTGQSLTTLESSVQTYTQNTLQAFKTAGVMPDIVQVGNETTGGILWNTGKLSFSGMNGGSTSANNSSWAAYGGLLNAGIAGVRAVQGAGPRIPVALSIDKGDADGQPQFHFGRIQQPVVVGSGTYGGGGVTDFDIEGVDFYSSSNGGITTMTNNLITLANTNFTANPNPTASNPLKKIMVLETNYPWEADGSYTGSWAKTPAGQAQEFADVRDMVKNLPHNDGEGALWWYPEAVQSGTLSIYQGGATAMFDDSGNDALPIVNDFANGLTPTWNVDSDGPWYNASDWTGGMPMFTDNVANFGTAITAPRTVTMNSAESTGSINFSSSISYTISGSNALTLAVSSGQAQVNVTAGSHTISAPLTLSSDTIFTITPPASTLTVTGALTATGRTITKSGKGALQFENVRAATLNVNLGTLRISPKNAALTPSGTSVVNSLSIVSNATLDLTNNGLVVDYTAGSSPLTTIAQRISVSYQGGAWTGPGMTSSTAAAVAADGANFHKTGLGYGEASALGLSGGSFGGQSTDNDAIVVRYTILGDANLNGSVDSTDFAMLANNFGATGIGLWVQGDFNYDGVVNALDFNAIAANYGQSLPLPSPGAELGSLVPEPSAALALTSAAFALAHRRRSRPSAKRSVANSKV